MSIWQFWMVVVITVYTLGSMVMHKFYIWIKAQNEFSLWPVYALFMFLFYGGMVRVLVALLR